MISGPEKATRGPLKASGLGVQYIQVAQAGTPAADTSLSQKILLESASEKDRISEVNLSLTLDLLAGLLSSADNFCKQFGP